MKQVFPYYVLASQTPTQLLSLVFVDAQRGQYV